MVNLEVGVDEDPLVVGYCGIISGYIPSCDCCPYSAEIMDKIAPSVGWNF